VKTKLKQALLELKGLRNVFIATMESDSTWRLDVNNNGKLNRGITLEAMPVDSFVTELLQEAGSENDARENTMASGNVYLDTENERHRIWLVWSSELLAGAFVRGVFCDNGSATSIEHGEGGKASPATS